MWVRTHHLSFYFISNYKEIEMYMPFFYTLHTFFLVNKQFSFAVYFLFLKKINFQHNWIIYLFIYLSIYLFIYLSIYLFIYLFIYVVFTIGPILRRTWWVCHMQAVEQTEAVEQTKATPRKINWQRIFHPTKKKWRIFLKLLNKANNRFFFQFSWYWEFGKTSENKLVEFTLEKRKKKNPKIN